MEKNYKKYLGAVFWTLIVIFILMLCFFLVQFSDEIRHSIFPGLFVLAVLFLLLGIILIILTKKAKIKGKQKLFLILTGASAPSFLIGVVLHNLFYALNILTAINFLKILTEALHVVFFLIAVIGCPIAFLAGVIGYFIVRRKRKPKRKKAKKKKRKK